MHEWRITKYDPSLRDRTGAYRGEDWTSWADIGSTFAGRELTVMEYLRTEDRYVQAARALFRGAGVPRVRILGLEVLDEVPERESELGLAAILTEGPPLVEGMRLTETDLDRVCRLLLRELVWCRLEAPGRFFLHFGYDYYMYAGSRADLPDALEQVTLLGLHVEPFPSPYLRRLQDEDRPGTGVDGTTPPA